MWRALVVLAAIPALGADRPSARVQAALDSLRAAAGKISNEKVRSATLDALKPNTCIAHRAGLTRQRKSQIIDQLVADGLADPADGARFAGGLEAGIFPAVKDDGSACPKLPQAFDSAPGSNFGGHHSYPGGLAIHESFNLTSAVHLADEYREKYGPGLKIDQDIIIAAPIWHDWAKTIVFQWNADGTEFSEINFGGSATAPTKTAAHHILSLAETMKRGLPAGLIVAQASAHAAPVLGNEPKVVNWIRAAALVAQVDAVAQGYLVRSGAGEWHLPGFRIEDSIHNLSDADFVVSIPAVTTMDGILKQLAPEFGFNADDAARYNNQFRNPVLSQLTAIRLLAIYGNAGLDGVRAEIKQARK